MRRDEPGTDSIEGGATGRLASVHPLPGVADGSGELTARQRLVLGTIRDSVEHRGYPPSMREKIGRAHV